MSESQLTIETWYLDKETLISLHGECDRSNVSGFNMAIADALLFENRQIVLDVSDLTYLAACGLLAIERAVESLRPVGGDLVVVGATGRVRRLLRFFALASDPIVIV